MSYEHSETSRGSSWRLSLLALLCVLACKPPPQPLARPILVHTLKCLREPPPPIPASQIEKGILEAGCPFGFTCLTGPAASAWARWTREIAEWSAEAWARCGPVLDAPAVSLSDASHRGSSSAGAADAGAASQ